MTSQPPLQNKTIRARLRDLWKKEQRLKERHERALLAIEQQRREIRSRCYHDRVRFFGDPASGSNKYYECAICGRWSCTRFGTMEEQQ